MSRPSDWYLVDLGSDPTPGESWGVRALAGAYGNIATIAGEVSSIVDAVNTTSQSGIWVGAAGDTFRTKIGELPTNARKCADSYGIARDAASVWAGKIDDTQARADTALNQARVAHEDLTAARDALTQALTAQSSSSRALSRTQDLYDLYKDTPPPAGVTVPTDWQLRQARNASASAASRVSSAESSQADAQARLDAAKRLVAEAKADYDDGARVVVAKLEDAKDAGVRADTWWEKIYHSDAWKVIVAVVTVVVIVAAIVLSGGAALAVLAIGGALLLADSLMAWQEGEISGGEFALAAVLTIVPGGKLVGALGKGLSAATRGVSAAVRGVRGLAGAGRAAGGATRVGDDLARLATQLRNPSLDDVTTRLRDITRKFADDYDNGAIRMTRRQERAAARKPYLAEMFRGDVIDTAAKRFVERNGVVDGLNITGRFKAGPDFHLEIGGQKVWWDMTTTGQWNSHVTRYGEQWGQGFHLPTDRLP